MVVIDTVIVVSVIVTCSLSIIGASFIILSFLLVPEFRQSPSRRLLFILSLCDLAVAIAYLLRTGNSHDKVDDGGGTWCEIQSAINIFANQASFFWTDFISLFLFLSRKYGVKTASKFIPLFHVISWGWPLISVTFVLYFRAWGPDGGDTTADWCWIGTHPTGFLSPNMWHLWAGKFVEWASCVFITIMYIFVFYDIRRKVDQSPATQLLIKNRTGGTSWKNTEKKLLAIPFIFIILRSAGTIRTIYYWKTNQQIHWLAVGQAIGDSGQGFANGLLFGLFTDKVRGFYYKLISHCTKDKSSMHSEGVNYYFAEDSYTVRYPPVIC